jgi:uncharacterized protein YjiS (DUF1127 family)
MAHAATLNSSAHANGLFNRVRTAISQYQSYRHTLGELNSLNNRELADLGLARSNLRDAARTAAYGL